MRLKEKVAVVTGASRGVGRAIALAFAEEGSDVVVTGRRRAPDETAERIEEMGRSSLSIVLDVRDGKAVDEMISETLKKFNRVDILVNNAGVFSAAQVVDMSEEEWDLNMDVNAKGVFLCCRAVAKEMIKHNSGGKIINISSNAGLVGYEGYSAYCASKRAVLAFTESLSKELAPFRINVNAICPGDVETDMLSEEIEKVAKVRSTSEDKIREEKLQSIPLHRFAKPEDIAKLAVFLASDESNHITGTFIKITGGK